MDRYMIVSTHTDASCTQALKAIEAAGFITHFDWGCKDGEHSGWAVIEADSAKEALMVVPSSERMHARAVRLVKFGPQEGESVHKH